MFHGLASADAQTNQQLRIVVSSKAVHSGVFRQALRAVHDMVKTVVSGVLVDLGGRLRFAGIHCYTLSVCLVVPRLLCF